MKTHIYKAVDWWYTRGATRDGISRTVDESRQSDGRTVYYGTSKRWSEIAIRHNGYRPALFKNAEVTPFLYLAAQDAVVRAREDRSHPVIAVIDSEKIDLEDKAKLPSPGAGNYSKRYKVDVQWGSCLLFEPVYSLDELMRTFDFDGAFDLAEAVKRLTPSQVTDLAKTYLPNAYSSPETRSRAPQ